MSDPIIIYRHEAPNPDRYYYDTQIPNLYGWGDGELAFRAYGTPQPGTVPIYRHRAKGGPDRYYYDKQIPNAYGWTDGECAFYAYETQQPDTVPIYRHRALGGPDRYYYDTHIPNAYGWSAGEVAFYAYPIQTTLVDDIVGVLGRQGAAFKGSTYLASSDNEFTLLGTPGLWDGGATVSQPTAACRELLTKITETIASAHDFLDITMMWQTWHSGIPWVPYGFPLGLFQAAFSEGFKRLTASHRMPAVRIMVGVPLGPVVTDENVKDWLRKTIELNGRQKLGDLTYAILIGCCKQSPESWNHAKIIAADDRAIVGGHNLWAPDYLGSSPVHDVSGLIEGSVVACARGFCDQLWKRPSAIPSTWLLKKGEFVAVKTGPVGRGYPKGRGYPTGKEPPTFTGTTRMLALGRLGFGIADKLTLASNASVSARIMAICRAKQSIRLSQQSLFFSAAGIGGFDFYTMWALVKAMQAGVNVQIVVSNDTSASDGGYTGSLRTVLNALATLYVADRLHMSSCPPMAEREDIAGWATASLNTSADSTLVPLIGPRVPSQAECAPLLAELNARLSLAPLYYAPGVNYWQVGNQRKPAANHAKVYIIDDTHFYVGSDNFYLSGQTHGLQEYGHLVEGKNETADFMTNYWDKLWKNSGPHAIRATYANVRLITPAMLPHPIVVV